jgi:hypothetical protein
MMPKQKNKFENDDFSKIAGPDYVEEPFEIESDKSNHERKLTRHAITGENKEVRGPEEAARRDLGLEEE